MTPSFSLAGFADYGLIEVVKRSLDILGFCIAVQLVISVTERSQNCVGIVTEVCLPGGFLCLQSG